MKNTLITYNTVQSLDGCRGGVGILHGNETESTRTLGLNGTHQST